MGAAPTSYDRIYAVVSRIPRGRVATYGQVAILAGLPRQARLVGYAMHSLPAESDVPWHRVVNAAGKISIRGDGLGHDELQAHLLAREGIRFKDGAIPLARYRWLTSAGGRSAGKAGAPSSPRGTSSSRRRRKPTPR